MRPLFNSMILFFAAFLFSAANLFALEVDREVMPRLTLGGRVIATLDWLDVDSGAADEAEISVADTSVLLRLDKNLYIPGVAGAVVGVMDGEGGLVMHQAHAFYWNRDMEVTIGRTAMPAALLEFPTLRDDDLLAYTRIGNGASDEEGDQVYGEVFWLDWFVDRKWQSLSAWAGKRATGSGYEDAGGLNSLGGGYRYRLPETLRHVHWLRNAGILIDSQQVRRAGKDSWLTAVIAGFECNLNLNPQYPWSTAVQLVYNDGLDGELSLATPAARARAASRALVTALRFTGRPQLLTRYQLSCTLAYKEFDDIEQASQFTVMPGWYYRIGQGIDLVAQAAYTWRDDGLPGGTEDWRIQAGLVFNFDSVFNDTIGERDSILNLEHGYID